MLVKDYWPGGTKWVTWEALSLASAYADYPYADTEGYPPVGDLAGQLNVVFLGSVGTGRAASLPEGTVWEVVDNGLGDFDLTARFAIEGHTGAWGVSVYEPALDEALRGVRVVGGEIVADASPNVSLVTTQSLDIYPLEPEYALPDRWWGYMNGELIPKEI